MRLVKKLNGIRAETDCFIGLFKSSTNVRRKYIEMWLPDGDDTLWACTGRTRIIFVWFETNFKILKLELAKDRAWLGRKFSSCVLEQFICNVFTPIRLLIDTVCVEICGYDLRISSPPEIGTTHKRKTINQNSCIHTQ